MHGKPNIPVLSGKIKNAIKYKGKSINETARAVLSDIPTENALRRFRYYLKNNAMPQDVLTAVSKFTGISELYLTGKWNEPFKQYIQPDELQSFFDGTIYDRVDADGVYMLTRAEEEQGRFISFADTETKKYIDAVLGSYSFDSFDYHRLYLIFREMTKGYAHLCSVTEDVTIPAIVAYLGDDMKIVTIKGEENET